MVEWLAGNRIKGTSTERTAGTPEVPAVITQGGWKEVGRTTFSGGGTSYSVSSLPDKRYYMILVNNFQSAQTEGDAYRLNSDTSNNFSYRQSTNGGSDGTGTSKSKAGLFGIHPHSQPSFAVGHVSNLSSKDKLGIFHGVGHGSNVSGAGNAPDRGEVVNKWANSTASIDEVNIKNNWNNYDNGSECVVLGWDPDDTHTTNFWEELASVDLSGGVSDTLSSGTFTAKKYLWFQAYMSDTGGAITPRMQFNNDTGSNYSRRGSNDGGADFTSTNATELGLETSAGKATFVNGFIVNNSSKEKLMMSTTVGGNTAGAGTVPQRKEIVAKWVNTSSQITEIDLNNVGAGDFGTNSFIKVWGSN